MLKILHEGHQGIVKCRARAGQSVWWPGMSVHISQLVERCSVCAQHRNAWSEPLLPTPIPERPWQRVGTDLFFWEKENYLLVVDYFSRYIEVARLKISTSSTIISALKEVFCRHGIPETVESDNGPQYSSVLFKAFATEYGFDHVTSIPLFPQANGEAERAVGTVKGLWKGGGDKGKALLTYRSMPLGNGYSPAQLLMGRQLRTTLPQLSKKLYPCWPGMREFQCYETKGRSKQQQYYNRRHRARPLSVLQPGQNVWLPLEKMQGSVVSQTSAPRSYLIGTEDGVIRRNRAHLRPIPQSEQVPPSDTEFESNRQPMPVAEQTDEHSYVTRSGRVSHPPKRMDL